MGQPAAKQGDQIQATDTHIVINKMTGADLTLTLPFKGTINGNLSRDVNIMGQPAATVGSTADNLLPHVPTPPDMQFPPGTQFKFKNPPTNKATIKFGSLTVNINGKPAARHGDVAETCSESPPPFGTVVATGTVNIG